MYGSQTLAEIEGLVQKRAEEWSVEVWPYQSNHEGAIIDFLQQERKAEGAIVNPGALAHNGYALRDALESFPGLVVEVHLTNIYAREPFRRESVTAPVSAGGGVRAGLARLSGRPGRGGGPAARAAGQQLSACGGARREERGMTDRTGRVRAAVAEAGLDALLVTNGQNRRYVSRFTGSAGWVLVGAEVASLATDFRYWEQAEAEAAAFRLYKQQGAVADWVPGFMEALGRRKVGFEAGDVSVAGHKQLRDLIAAMPPDKRPALVQTEGLVEKLRAVKDAEEIAALERAARLGDEAFGAVAGRIEPGWSEQRVAWEIERYAREHGAAAMSFATIVGGGPWGAMPHAHPRTEPIVAGQPIVIDMGVVVEGYCSDMTRTIVVGEGDAQFGEIYEIVLTAQETAEATIEVGMTGAQAHQIAQEIIAEAGYGERFGHGLGHGVGLEIHEQPRLGATSEDVLAEGMVITVEPGIYLPGWGGVRIEDMGVLENGRYRNFTTAPKLRLAGAG